MTLAVTWELNMFQLGFLLLGQRRKLDMYKDGTLLERQTMRYDPWARAEIWPITSTFRMLDKPIVIWPTAGFGCGGSNDG